MEIERKFLINEFPYSAVEFEIRIIEQGYLCTEPVVRVRRDNEDYYLTYKSKGFLEREEYDLPLTKEAYEHMKEKIDGRLITKKRVMVPLEDGLIAEVDFFEGYYDGLVLAEVEFESKEKATSFTPPLWFGKEVTYSSEYHNSTLSQK